jgi:hypothetical protein
MYYMQKVASRLPCSLARERKLKKLFSAARIVVLLDFYNHHRQHHHHPG